MYTVLFVGPTWQLQSYWKHQAEGNEEEGVHDGENMEKGPPETRKAVNITFCKVRYISKLQFVPFDLVSADQRFHNTKQFISPSDEDEE